MTDSLRTVPPSIPVQETDILAKAQAIRSAGNRATRMIASSDHDDQDARLKEAGRLIQLAEELYQRADELVKQAQELLPPDDTPEESDS